METFQWNALGFFFSKIASPPKNPDEELATKSTYICMYVCLLFLSLCTRQEYVVRLI